ncbi:thymidine phosphorylase [Pseudomonas putida]|nr:thymidine phosphorylase [Pseudomonas putida]
MQKEGKVVPLAAAIDRGGRTPLPCLPVLLLQVRDKAALQLRQGLQDLFDNADDTLFEMADKAFDRYDQHLYFEAMRDLRLKRKSIERGFLDTFHDTFARIGQPDPLAHLAEPGSLRSKAQRERAAAMEGMVARVLSRDGIGLQQLGLRLQALLDRPLHEQHNPLGPAALCGYFLDAGRNLGVGLRVKLVLLKLFERYVLRDADILYADANQLLAAAGVLPELQPAPRRRVEDRRLRTRRGPLSQGQDVGADAAGQAYFASLQTLLAPLRGQFAPRLQAVAAAQPISTADLIRLLTHLQHYVPATHEADDFELGQQLEQLLLRVSVRSGTRRRIAVDDEDVINLVGLVFAFIQRDDNLPASLRALLARLHIPLLKVALLDKGLFSRARHPGRRLINEIAGAAIGWAYGSEGLRDSLHLRVECTVQRLLNDFAEDAGLFAELLDEFLASNQEERRRNELLEQRTRDAEEGRARALQARHQVQQVLNQRLRGRVLPLVVVQMLVQAWSQVLQLAWLKQGEASQGWRDALQTVDALLASITPGHEPQALLQQVPGLLKALRDGLASVALDSAATREFFLQLEQLHLHACAGTELPAGHDKPFAEVLVDEDIVLAMAEEPACAPRQFVDGKAATLQHVQRLRIGSWVEVMDDGEPLRCKLVAHVGSNDRLVFANRTGMKVREWNSTALAQALHRGDVRMLDDGLLFERALEAVIDGLRQPWVQ